jgi:hypothetical protein
MRPGSCSRSAVRTAPFDARQQGIRFRDDAIAIRTLPPRPFRPRYAQPAPGASTPFAPGAESKDVVGVGAVPARSCFDELSTNGGDAEPGTGEIPSQAQGEMPSQAQGEMPSQRRRVARQLRRAAAQSSLPFALSLSKGGKVALSVATIGHCGTSRSASRNEHQGSLFTQRMASTNSPPANRDAALAPTPVAFYPTPAAMPDRWP